MNDQMQNILSAALLLVIPAVAAFVAQWLNTKTQALKQQSKNAELNKFIDIATQTISAVVGAISQTTVDAIKCSAENGKLTDTQKAQFYNEALKSTILILNDETKKALDLAFADSREWMRQQIEYAVRNNK